MAFDRKLFNGETGSWQLTATKFHESIVCKWDDNSMVTLFHVLTLLNQSVGWNGICIRRRV